MASKAPAVVKPTADQVLPMLTETEALHNFHCVPRNGHRHRCPGKFCSHSEARLPTDPVVLTTLLSRQISTVQVVTSIGRHQKIDELQSDQLFLVEENLKQSTSLLNSIKPTVMQM